MQKQDISAMFSVQGMRKFVCDRLTEAAQEILGAFEKRAQEYELELSRQRRQLESVFSPELKQRTDLGSQIKEEQHDISISEIQQPNTSTSAQGVHSEFQSSGPKDVQNTAFSTQQKQGGTTHQETEASSSHQSEPTDSNDQTVFVSGSETPTKHAHSHKKCSHGYRLPRSFVSKQRETNKNKAMLSSNAKTEPPLMEIIEIIDISDSPASDDMQVIQPDNESGRKQNAQSKVYNKTCKSLNKKGKHEHVTVESKETHKHKSKSSTSPQCSLPHTQDANLHDYDDYKKIATITNHMENVSSTANGKLSTCSNVPSVCSEPTQYGEYIALSEDLIQNEEHIGEKSTGARNNDTLIHGITEGAKFQSPNLKTVDSVAPLPNASHNSSKRSSPQHSSIRYSNYDNNNMGNILSTTNNMSANTPRECSEATACEGYITLSEDEMIQNDDLLWENFTGTQSNDRSLYEKCENEKLAKEFNNITIPSSESMGSENYNTYLNNEPVLNRKHNDELRISDESTEQTEINKDSLENMASMSQKRQNDKNTESYVSNMQSISKRNFFQVSSANQETIESEMYSHNYNTSTQITTTTSQESQSNKKMSDNNPLECDRCGKVLSNFKNYKSHMKSHTVEKSFKCETCGKMFREAWHLNKHVIIHNVEKPFECATCGRGFNRRTNLDLHMRIHTGEKPYPCGSCEKAFTSRVNLKKHERMHTGEKPYTCDHCKKEFADCSSFRNHRRIHTGEKPYKCSWCKKRFATRTTLKRHLRIHTGEKPYKCSVCEKGFTTNTDMKVHLRIHTGERPYQCKNCGQTFSCWTNYNRHQNVHK